MNSYCHEKAHKRIYEYGGCKEIETYQGFIGELYLNAHTKCLTEFDKEYYKYHAINETIGYHTTAIIITLLACTAIILSAIYAKE